jgi:hypothetical protein
MREENAGRSRQLNHSLGRSSSDTPAVPLHYPLLALLVIATSILPTTWLLSSDLGYLIAGATLVLVIVYGVLFTGISFTFDSAFLVLFGGYWLGLVAHYQYHSPHSELLVYVLVTPIAVLATVIVLPRFVEGRRQTFTMGLALLSVLVALIGVWVLWQPGTIDTELPEWVGEEVMGLYEIRTTSVFRNPNTYGFFMMVGSLAALYTLLVRGGVVWIVALGICLLGLFMSEGDAALVGFGIGSILVIAGRSQLLSFLGIGAGVAALYALIRIGHLPEVMETTLMGRIGLWVLALERLTLDPLWGIGFGNASEELGTMHGPHNSYIAPLLNSGVIAGSLYLGALAYAFANGIRRRWTAWSGYVVGTASGVFTYMMFESLFLGGLSTSSVVLGLFVGLMLASDSDLDEESRPVPAERIPTGRIERVMSGIREGQ